MPPENGSTPERPAAGTDSRQSWTVKRSGDTTEIDLGEVVISSSDPDFLNEVYAERNRNVHILNGGIEFGAAGFVPLTTMQPITTLRLTSVKLTVTSGIEEGASTPGSIPTGLLLTSEPSSSFILEDCVFETAVDSPVISQLVVCAARFAGQITMINCKFYGFRRVVSAIEQCKVVMKDCLVDLTTKGAYGGEDNAAPVIYGAGPQVIIELTNCQLAISCAYMRGHVMHAFVHIWHGCTATLEGVTFTGRTDLAASKDAPAISMVLHHLALYACGGASARLKGCAFVGGQVSCAGAGTRLHCEDCHFSGHFLGSACVKADADITLHRCTIQNLCGDRSHAGQVHSALTIPQSDGHAGSAELNDCVLENVHGSGMLHANCGQAKLTQCTVRRCGAGPAEQVMTPYRFAAVQLDGAVTVDMQHCYVEGGLNCAAVAALHKAHITCKDSLLVGWGGGTDQDKDSCPVAVTWHEGTRLDLDRCTVQFHPDSRHPLIAGLLWVSHLSRMRATECRLIGPTPGSSCISEFGVSADNHSTASLDKCSLLQVKQAALSGLGASIAFVLCKGHQGAVHLESAPEHNIKALKCTHCSGCQECRQPVPLVTPEGTGGSGCSAEVAAKAAALHAALYKSTPGNVAAGGGTHSSTDANPALVECAVCHRKPGDPGVPATLKLCGGCHTTRYCSIECQRKDWKMGHKEACKLFRSLKGHGGMKA